MRTILTAIALAAVLALPAKAGGVNKFSIGASTGTNLVVISATPASYWGVLVTSAAANDLFKCWDASSVGTLTISSAATLGGQMYQTAAVNVGPSSVLVNAANGIVCGKSSASSEAVVFTSGQ